MLRSEFGQSGRAGLFIKGMIVISSLWPDITFLIALSLSLALIPSLPPSLPLMPLIENMVGFGGIRKTDEICVNPCSPIDPSIIPLLLSWRSYTISFDISDGLRYNVTIIKQVH